MNELLDWVSKYNPITFCVWETCFKHKGTILLNIIEGQKIYHANFNQKKARAVVLISEKIDFGTRTIIRDKEGYYIW